MIRKAIYKDITDLYSLYKKVALDWNRLNDNKYKLQIQQSGFVYGSNSKVEFEKEFNKASETFICEENGELFGFAMLNNETYFPKDAKDAIWIRPEFKEKYYQKISSRTVYYLVVDSSLARKGVGSKLIKKVEQELKQIGIKYIFLLVQINPIINAASVSFYSKQNYEAVCITSPKNMKFKNYMSMVMEKKV